MNPKESVLALMKAIESKDMKSLRQFLPKTGPLAIILSDGSAIDNVEEFIEFFEEWFEEELWSMSNDLVFIEESPEMAFAVFDGNYFDKDDDGTPYSISFYTTFVMRYIDDKWVLVHYHQTEGDED